MGRTASAAKKKPVSSRSTTKSSRTRSSSRSKQPAKSAAAKTTGRSRTSSSRTRTKAKGGFKAMRSFRTAQEYLNAQVNYERRPITARERKRFTLARMKRVLADLDHPERDFRSVHIAGSKGKGSTAAMLAAMLQENKLTVGLYTSPHILTVRERICVNGEMISESHFAKMINKVAQVSHAYSDPLTYFEILTAAAFLYFKEQRVDIAVVETGLGGRLDATNLLQPEVCGITSINLDHTEFLGKNLEEIATEKAGIFKSGVPVISSPQDDAAKKSLQRAAAEANVPLMFSGDEITFSYRFESSHVAGPQARICVTTPSSHFDHLAVPLVGEHQAVNCGVAIGLLDQLKHRGFAINDEAAIAGLAKVRVEGRMELVCEEPRVLVDGAHNAASIEALMRAIGQNIAYDSMVLIFGCCGDKDVKGMLEHIQLGADKIIFTRVQSPRASDSAELASAFAEMSGRMAQVAPNLRAALEIADKAITREDLICITGSFYLVAEAKRLFADHPRRPASR